MYVLYGYNSARTKLCSVLFSCTYSFRLILTFAIIDVDLASLVSRLALPSAL